MNKLLNSVILAAAIVALAGCVETKDDFTINPDGSGKVVHELTFQPMSFDMTGGGTSFEMTPGEISLEMNVNEPPGESSFDITSTEPDDPQAQVKKSVKEILTKSSGVDTWTDISYKMTIDDRVYFKGTAFFSDINKLSLHNAGFSSDMKLSFTHDQSGQIIIEFQQEEQGESVETGETVQQVPPPLSEAELNQLVQQAKMQYNESKPMMMAVFSALKTETILHLPGKISQVSNFEKIDDSTVRIAFDGSKLISIMDQMMQNDDWLKEQIRAGKDPVSDGPESGLVMNEMLFGEKAPIRVVLGQPAQQLFDYDAEVADAKANYDTMLEQLDLDKTETTMPTITDTLPVEPTFPVETTLGDVTPVVPVQGAGLTNVKVAAVRLVMYSDHERGIMPLGQNKGYTLSLMVDLPEPVIKVSGGRVEKAVTDSTKSLLPTHKWQREIHFPRLTNDKKTVIFDVELLLPDDQASGFQEVSGVLEYLTADSLKQVDLGIMDFQIGAKGTQLGAVIRSIEEDPWQQNATVLRLRLNVRPEAIKSVNFYTQDGIKMDTNQTGYTSIDSSTTFEFSVKGQLPQKGRIVLDAFDGLTKNVIPFKITDITLTGQSLW